MEVDVLMIVNLDLKFDGLEAQDGNVLLIALVDHPQRKLEKKKRVTDHLELDRRFKSPNYTNTGKETDGIPVLQ